MKNLIVLGMFIVLSLMAVSCTCSREKKEKELSIVPECSQEDLNTGTCGEKKVKGPRKIKLNPRQMTLNRELLNRAFNEQLKDGQSAPREDKPAAAPSAAQSSSDAATPQSVARPVFPASKIRLPLNDKPTRESAAPEKGASR